MKTPQEYTQIGLDLICPNHIANTKTQNGLRLTPLPKGYHSALALRRRLETNKEWLKARWYWEIGVLMSYPADGFDLEKGEDGDRWIDEWCWQMASAKIFHKFTGGKDDKWVSLNNEWVGINQGKLTSPTRLSLSEIAEACENLKESLNEWLKDDMASCSEVRIRPITAMGYDIDGEIYR